MNLFLLLSSDLQGPDKNLCKSLISLVICIDKCFKEIKNDSIY